MDLDWSPRLKQCNFFASGHRLLRRLPIIISWTRVQLVSLAQLKNWSKWEFLLLVADSLHSVLPNPGFGETEQGRVGIVNWVTPETNPDLPDDAGVGPNLWPGNEAAAIQITDLRRRVDWVVVYLHWSDELFPYPLPIDREIGRKLIKSGADAVVGNHAHAVRGIEEVDGKPIFYSLGNYFFPRDPKRLQNQPAREREALIVELCFRQGERLSWQLHSYRQDGARTIPDPGGRAVRRAHHVSRRFKVSDYSAWYVGARRRFNRWGYRWHFRLPIIGWRGVMIWLLRAAGYSGSSV